MRTLIRPDNEKCAATFGVVTVAVGRTASFGKVAHPANSAAHASNAIIQTLYAAYSADRAKITSYTFEQPRSAIHFPGFR